MAKPQKEAPMASVDEMRAAFHERMHANHMYGLWELASQMTPHRSPRCPLHVAVVRSRVDGRGVRRGRARRRGAARPPAVQPRSRRPLGHDEQPDRRRTDAPARRGRPRPPPHADGHPLHHRRHRRLYRRRWRARLHGARRPRPDAELGLARPRQRDRQDRVVWMDGLDIPLVQSLEAMFFQLYSAPGAADQAEQRLQAAARPRAASPTWVKEKPARRRCSSTPGSSTWEALDALRDARREPRIDGIALEYRHPQTGGSVLPTMACWLQMLRPGERTKAHRQTGSAVYYVVRGRRRDDHRRAALRLGQGRHLRVAVLGAPRARQRLAKDARSSSRSRTAGARGAGPLPGRGPQDNGGHQKVTTNFSPD